jgi:2-polyprenyl-3-methyl-5-hydroxy-6-metoxy-1,4-benzoquinol methylase
MNKKIYNNMFPLYEQQHVEIFNRTEQTRIRTELQWALDQILSNANPPRTLDFGAGTGNLTRHLLDLGALVTAADVSKECLKHLIDAVGRTGRLNTIFLNGSDLAHVPAESFDMVATYSVLHHIPDYLASVRELVRVMKPGGIIVIDHENSPSFWEGDANYACYIDELSKLTKEHQETFPERLKRVFWRKGIFRYLRAVAWHLRNPNIGEGDIHVHPEDHIEWQAIRGCLEPTCDILKEVDYLVCREVEYPAPVWEKWHKRTTDMRMVVARKQPPPQNLWIEGSKK